jgi:hypothetical protein
MDKPKYTTGGYILAVALGAIAGGVAVAIITRAIPVMMSKMMGNMMTRMNAEGCDPEEM